MFFKYKFVDSIREMISVLSFNLQKMYIWVSIECLIISSKCVNQAQTSGEQMSCE